MKKVSFTKMQGTGNDFVRVGRPSSIRAGDAGNGPNVCDRRFGVGADQVLVLAKSTVADFKMLIYNADGSQVEMCGNGIRCLARYACRTGRVQKKGNDGGNPGRHSNGRHSTGERVRVDMGAPDLGGRARFPPGPRGG
jgi:diaminopimelate epimerase